MSARGSKKSRALDQELLHAAYRGERELVLRLLEQGASARYVSPYGETALMGACQHNDFILVEALLHAGADIQAVRDTYENLYSRETPLTKAVSFGHATIVRLLLSRGAELDFFGDDARCLMYAACASGNEETVQLLEERGAQPPREMTPLIYAIVRGRTEECRRLLATGMAPDKADTVGITPLEWAALYGRTEAAELLEQAGLCVRDDPKALHAAARGDSAALCAWLTERGISPEQPDDGECTALEIAIGYNSLQAAEALLQHGASPHQPCSLCLMPLAVAAGEGNLPMSALLLRYGADINGTAYDGGATALIEAVKEDREDMVRFLLEQGADIEQADCDEWTPLFFTQTASMARLLLDFGADPDACDLGGDTPLQVARALKRDNKELIALLRAASK
ncbi:MAG: ankyrin repeat domain-containing protein [Akkermansia sp.]